MDEILTAEQVAKILQVHPFTVLKFIKQGKLKASKLGRVYRIRRRDVDEFLDNLMEEGQRSRPEQQKKKTSQHPARAGKLPDSNSRKDQKTPRSEKKGPPIELPHEEVEKKPEKPKRSNENDLDHYKLAL